MLVNSKKMLEEAKIGHYAVPAANIVNLENIKGVIEAAEETKHPLMVCLAEVHTPTLGIEEAASTVTFLSCAYATISFVFATFSSNGRLDPSIITEVNLTSIAFLTNSIVNP